MLALLVVCVHMPVTDALHPALDKESVIQPLQVQLVKMMADVRCVICR